MNNQAIQCVANANTSRFSVENDICTFLSVATGIKISVYNSSAGLNYRYPGVVTNILNQALAAPRNNNVNKTDGV